MDVPPDDGCLAVNFGQVLERWTGGRIRATEHRVLSGVAPFEPFYFGDHLWETTTRFVEQRGIAHLRRPMGPPRAERAAERLN
jgi:hypothetical protein